MGAGDWGGFAVGHSWIMGGVVGEGGGVLGGFAGEHG